MRDGRERAVEKGMEQRNSISALVVQNDSPYFGELGRSKCCRSAYTTGHPDALESRIFIYSHFAYGSLGIHADFES